METTAKYIVDEIIEEQCGEPDSFKIDNDEKAAWALEKIAVERSESQRYIDTCERMIIAYQEKMAKEKERLANKTSYLESQLREYFDGVEKKTTKTKASYRLPTGTLTMKIKKKVEKDDKKLEEFLDMSYVDGPDFLECIETKKVKWAEFKKTLNFVDGKAVTSDGEVLEFITETTEQEFVVEV